MFSFTNAQLLSSKLKVHCAIWKCNISKKISLRSLLPEKKNCNSGRWAILAKHGFLSSRANPDEFPHLVSTGWKMSGPARAKSPGCMVCSEWAQIWLISLFGFLLWCGPVSHSITGRFKKPGHGDDTAAGGTSLSLYWHHWARSLRAGRGGRAALWRAQHASAHERPGWPFPLRRLYAKAQATGRSEQRWAWLWERERERPPGRSAQDWELHLLWAHLYPLIGLV